MRTVIKVEIKKANLGFKREPGKRRDTEGIIVHHLAYEWDATPQDIHAWHLERGWIGGGYNLYVRRDGVVYEIRPIDAQGAHARGYNSTHLGVALEGHFDKEYPTDEQYISLAKIINEQRDYHGRIPVTSHSDHAETSCPGQNFDWDRLQEELNKMDEQKDYEYLGKAEIVQGEVRGEKAEGYLIDSTTYVPLRLVGEKMGQDISWDSETRTWRVE